jgi:uncharacterized protein YgiM (DUF1202 family)
MQNSPSTTWRRQLLGPLAAGLTLCCALIGAAALPATASAAEMVSVRGQVLNMRSGPGTHHEIQWQLQRGFPLKVIGRQGNWLKVLDFENDTGWVARPLTKRTPHHIVKARIANVRSGPSTRHRVVGKAAYGEVLRTLDRRASWVRVQRGNGSRGWVSRSLLWGW